MSYFNTTNETNPELAKYRKKAQSQDERVLAFFEGGRGEPMTPSDVLQGVFGASVPITSVRRSMTNLTNEGKLVKLDKKKPGPYGRPEYCWQIAKKAPHQWLLIEESPRP